MYRIDNATASSTLPTPSPAGPVTNGYFTIGDPGTKNATIVDADWMNSVQEEIINVISGAGIPLVKGTMNQLETAIRSYIFPSGGIVMWSGTVATIPAGWLLCNGQNGTPNLLDRFIIGAGDTYAPGASGGAATGSGTTSTVAAHNHGGADGVAGPFGMSGAADEQGSHSHGGATAASAPDMNSHTHSININTVGVASGVNLINVLGSASSAGNTNSTGSSSNHAHGIAVDGLHSHNISVSNAPAHQHTISEDGSHSHTVTVPTLPPYYALAYIMKS
jgi:hypothetical protein